jgi:hypothetical protein
MSASRNEHRIRVRRPRQHVRLKGAIAALVSCVAAAVLVTGTARDSIEDIARLALVLPAFLYVLWWTLAPYFSANSREEATQTAGSTSDPELLIKAFDGTEEFAPLRHGYVADESASGLRDTVRHPGGTVPPELRPGFRGGEGLPETASGGS